MNTLLTSMKTKEHEIKRKKNSAVFSTLKNFSYKILKNFTTGVS